MKTVLSIGAHPDDIEIGCGGTEILLRQQGCHLIHLLVTSGEEGGMHVNKLDLAEQREREASAAAKIIGADEIIFLRCADGLTHFDNVTKLRLINIIRQHRPDIIFTHASSDAFPDHHLVHQLTVSAITAAAGPWYPESVHTPHLVTQVYGYEVWHPLNQYQLIMPIEQVIEQKLAALNCHQSQINDINYLAAAKGLAAYRGVMSLRAAYAEAFEVIRSPELV